MTKLIIFTDGASKGNPGPGGWGAIVASDERVTELGGRETQTTNNRMELQAAYEALLRAATLSASEIDVYADSSYVIQGALTWGRGWRRNDWVTASKQPVLNRDLWEPFLDLLDSIAAKIRWHNVGGHVGIGGNERVDEIASSYALGKDLPLYSGARGEYPIDLTNINVDENLQQKKSESRSRSKAKAYSYVSEVDGIVQVHRTWAECEARVRGKKARFKKALSAHEEAEIVQAFSQ